MQTAHPLPQSGAVSSSRTTRRHVPRWAWIVLALLLVAAGVAWFYQSRATPAVTTTTVPLTRGDLPLSVNGSGSVAPAASVNLPFQVAGQVTAVKVVVGDAVKAGEPLATLDTRDLQNQVAAAQAAVQAAQAKLDQLQHGGSTPQDLTSAQAAVQAAQASAHKTRTGNVTAADIQSAQAAVQSAQAKLDALKNPSPAALSAAQSTLAQAQANEQTTSDGDSAAKNNAYQAMQQAADNLTKAQSAYATAQQNWQSVQDTGNTGNAQLVEGNQNLNARVTGAQPTYLALHNLSLADGAFISDNQVTSASNVVVLGANVASKLFPAGGSVGKLLRINRQSFQVLGVLIGVALGAAIAAGVSLAGVMKAVIAPTSVVLALGFAMAVGLFFGIAPARSAARLDPIEALRQD